MTDKTPAPQPEWKVLTFRDYDDGAPAAADARAEFIRERAMVRFYLNEADFNMAVAPAYPGTVSLLNIENGGHETRHVYEVQISKEAAERVLRMRDPDVMLVSDAVEPPRRGMGAIDPKKLPKGPKIRW